MSALVEASSLVLFETYGQQKYIRGMDQCMGTPKLKSCTLDPGYCCLHTWPPQTDQAQHFTWGMLRFWIMML